MDHILTISHHAKNSISLLSANTNQKYLYAGFPNKVIRNLVEETMFLIFYDDFAYNALWVANRISVNLKIST